MCISIYITSFQYSTWDIESNSWTYQDILLSVGMILQMGGLPICSLKVQWPSTGLLTNADARVECHHVELDPCAGSGNG